MNISKIIGFRFDSLEEAEELVNPGQVIVTEVGETFYIVKSEVFIQSLYPLNYYTV